MSAFAAPITQPELASDSEMSGNGNYGTVGADDKPERVVGPLLRGLDSFEGTELSLPLRKGKVFAAAWAGGDLKKGFGDVLKWKIKCGAPKFPSAAEAAARCPTVPRMDLDAIRCPSHHCRVQATWMGHASYLVQVNGLNILTDPVWSDRAAPVQFTGPKRFVPPPIQLEDLPCRIDVVTISHNHYDHLDTATVQRLRNLFDPFFVVPLGMKSQWFEPLWRSSHPASLQKVHELSWWECAAVSVPIPESSSAATVYVTAVPVQHWSLRNGLDRNHQLWCGFVYEIARREVHVSPNGFGAAASSDARDTVVRCFHSGDTGYCSVFRDIGKVFGRFDLAMIAIGAYHPRWFLSVQHVDPEEAVKIHLDLNRPALSCGMHWGTFILTDEPIDEPPLLLHQAATSAGLEPGEFIAPNHGQTARVLEPCLKRG